MTPSFWLALTAVSAALLGFWLSHSSTRTERQAMQVGVARAQKGESEWAQLAVHRQAVIAALEARAVEDAGRIEELRAQVERDGLSVSLHFHRVRLEAQHIKAIRPMVLEEAEERARQALLADLFNAEVRRSLMEEALKAVQAERAQLRGECADLRAQLEAVQAGSTS